MDDEKDKKGLYKILNAVLSLAVVCSVGYILVVGVDLVSGLILLSAIGGVAGPAVVAGEGFLDIISCIFEAFVEGLQAILSAVAEIVGSVFG